MNASTLVHPLNVVNMNSLEDLVTKLVHLETSDSPIISCYVDLTKPREAQVMEIQRRGAIARSGLRGQARHDFDDGLVEIIDYLKRRQLGSKKSLAVFSRWGDDPVFAPMELEAPMEDQVSVDRLPVIYPLVALDLWVPKFWSELTSIPHWHHH